MPAFAPGRDSFLAALAQGEVLGRSRASPLVRVASTWAKLHKRLRGG